LTTSAANDRLCAATDKGVATLSETLTTEAEK